MATPVVEYVYDELLRIDDGSAYNVTKNDLDFDKEVYIAETAYDVCKGKNDKLLKIPHSGQVFLYRDKDGNVISKKAEYHLTDKCTESSPVIKLKNVRDILLPFDEIEDKFFLKKGACAGILRRERESGKLLCQKLKDVIYSKFPDLKE